MVCARNNYEKLLRNKKGFCLPLSIYCSRPIYIYLPLLIFWIFVTDKVTYQVIVVVYFYAIVVYLYIRVYNSIESMHKPASYVKKKYNKTFIVYLLQLLSTALFSFKQFINKYIFAYCPSRFPWSKNSLSFFSCSCCGTHKNITHIIGILLLSWPKHKMNLKR